MDPDRVHQRHTPHGATVAQTAGPEYSKQNQRPIDGACTGSGSPYLH